MKKLIFAAMILSFLCACTPVVYRKAVTRTFDSSGNLISTEVVESVVQTDPATQPLRDDLKSIAEKNLSK